MISFDAAHKAVHYPPDRRFRIWIRPSFVATAPVCTAGLSPYRRGGTLVALHRCLWVHYHRVDFCDVALRNGAMEKDCAYLRDRTDTSLEYVRPLCQLPSAAGTERFLRIQCASAARLFCCSLSFRTTFDFDRHRDVACVDKPLSAVPSIVWRPAGGALHLLLLLGYIAFLAVHVTLVVLTGFARNMNHIVLGTDDQKPLGIILGFVGIAVVIVSWIVAHYTSWKFPRLLQHIQWQTFFGDEKHLVVAGLFTPSATSTISQCSIEPLTTSRRPPKLP